MGIGLCLLLFGCTYDMLHGGIPRRIVVLIALASVFNVLLDGDFISSALAAIITLAILGGQCIVGQGMSISRDDVYIGTILAFWLGCKKTVIMLVSGYIIGSLVVIALLLSVGIRKKHRMVIAPFLSIGAIVAMLFHAHIRISYFS